MRRVHVATQSRRVPVHGNSRSSRTGGVVCGDEYNNSRFMADRVMEVGTVRGISAFARKGFFSPITAARTWAFAPPPPPTPCSMNHHDLPLDPTVDKKAPTQAVVVVAAAASRAAAERQQLQLDSKSVRAAAAGGARRGAARSHRASSSRVAAPQRTANQRTWRARVSPPGAKGMVHSSVRKAEHAANLPSGHSKQSTWQSRPAARQAQQRRHTTCKVR